MRKIAVFVEGQGELVAIRNLLLHKFDSQVAFSCLKLYRKGEFSDCPYNYHPDSEFHYYIYNVGNDNNVIDEILTYENSLWGQGFEKIIGLRDMYSQTYKSFSKKIDLSVNDRFIRTHDKTIKDRATHPEKIHFRFSIMEMEAWVLGMFELFAKFDPILTPQYIQEKLLFNLSEIDPESHFFKPANDLGKILGLIGRKYDKHLEEVESIFSKVDKQDFINLYDKAICKSYNDFCDVLI